MNADSVLIRRLTTYWKIEAGNVVFVPSIAIYLVLSSGGTISAALVLSCLACSFLLVIGTMALRMMLRKARGDAGATKTRIPLLRGLRWPALALCVAAADGSVQLLRLLLDAGADVNTRRGLPLVLAVDGGHLEAARLLLERGAAPDEIGRAHV